MTMPLPKRAVFYRRVSTDKQDLSLEAQETRALRYLEFRELPLGEGCTFGDDATSGRTPFAQRKGGAALLRFLSREAAAGRPVTDLVCVKLDRLGRKARDVLALAEQLTAQGVVLHFADCGGDAISTGGTNGKLFLGMLALIAEWEADTIRDRTREAIDEKRARGEALGGTEPYGWRHEPSPDGRLSKTSGLPVMLPVKVPEEQAVIARMKAMAAAGDNASQIARALNRDGIPTKNLGRWDWSRVTKVLAAKVNQAS